MSDINPAAETPPQSAVAPPSDLSVASGGGGLLAMIERLASNPGINLDVFDRLLQARRQEEDRAAERAFNAALSRAKGELSPVLKTHIVDFAGKAGGRTQYKYEAFADVARTVDPVFQRHGLSYRFSVAQSVDTVSVTCIISHDGGYSERTTLVGKVDPGASGMSVVQALGSSLTYLQRYSLRAAIGLAAGVDDDGRAAGGKSPKISGQQADDLRNLIQETGRSEVTLLRLIGVDELNAMTTEQYGRAKEVLELAAIEQRARKHAAGN